MALTKQKFQVFAGRLGLVLTSIVLTFLYLEIGTQWAFNYSVLTTRDFRQQHAAKPLNDAIKTFIRSAGFNTLEFGFCSNGILKSTFKLVVS